MCTNTTPPQTSKWNHPDDNFAMAGQLHQIIFQHNLFNAAHDLACAPARVHLAFVHRRLVHLVRVPSYGHG